MKKTVACDVCGKEMPADEAVYDVGSERDLCQEHAITEEIADLERQIRSKREPIELELWYRTDVTCAYAARSTDAETYWTEQGFRKIKVKEVL